jgi:hypothetical protein
MIFTSITGTRMDELLRFLPLFEGPAASFLSAPDTGLRSPLPPYSPVVVEFFDVASQPWWDDHGYDPLVAGEMVHNDAAIATASLGQIKAMLTFCVRSERFCDGAWLGLLEHGRIVAILRRLQTLRGR